MSNGFDPNITQLSAEEEKEIGHKVDLEIAKSHNSMLKLGAYANILSGIFIIWILYNHVNFSLLMGWYGAIVITSLIDVWWARRYEASYIIPSQLKAWRRVFYVIVAAICLAWTSLGIVFVNNDLHYELYTITFLQVVVFGFCFTSITDFVVASIAIACLLLPTIIYRIYLAIHSILTVGYDPSLNIAIALSLFILGAFMLPVCYFAAHLVRKFFFVSFANVTLNQKLENANKFLEQRVQERTIELEKTLKTVTYQATHDLLTDLPNQRSLLDFMQSALKKANKNNAMFCVIFFTLNEIEKINDGLGHQVGDFVIKSIAQRFQEKFGEYANINKPIKYTVTLSRKDVFVILLEPIFKLEEIEPNVEPLFSILDDPVYSENQVIKLTASIGISVFPRNGRDVKTLLMNADAAMLRAKQYGGNSLNMYKTEINADISRQLELESNLHTALKNSEFNLQYQPFVDVKTGEITGVEALVRWENPTLGRISPDNFIPLAEANGIIIPLGEWVFYTACVQTKLWHQLGFKNIKVAINLSAKQLTQKNFVETIKRILQKVDLSPEFIELELTETAAFQEDVLPILKQFKAMGLGLSVDDFGTGYSSLSNLKLIEIDKIKIDKSFVQDLATNHDSRAIVSNTIALAKKMKITILAEGVENKEQLKFLKENGCELIQGYYFSQPVNADVFTELLISKKRYEV